MKKHLLTVWLCATPLAAQADSWQYSLSPYLWLPTISVESERLDDAGSAINRLPLEIGPTNYLQALNFGLMLTGDMRKDDWVLLGDLIYLSFGINNNEINILGGPATTTAKADLRGSILTLSAGRTFARSDNFYTDALLGWRRFAMSLELSIDLLNNGTVRKLDSQLDYNDAFVGINGRYAFSNDRWSLRYYADIGTGESDVTWQALIGVGYAFGWGELFANYRHLHYAPGDAGPLEDLTNTFSGPSVGVTFRF